MGAKMPHTSTASVWRTAVFHAVPISLFVLILFYYWFAVANRYAVFLYEHLGATPFDEVTSSRYWMAGLVASGAVVLIYTTVNLLLGWGNLLFEWHYSPPKWRRVWILCAPPAVIGIPAITMTLNSPTLPLSIAAKCVVAVLVGLALALLPSSLAAQRPRDLIWLSLDALGLMPVLHLFLAIDLPSRGLISMNLAIALAVGSVIAGIIWLGVMTGLRRWRRRSSPDSTSIFLGGLCLSYLLMPLAHHLLATPAEAHYITTSSNFFARSPAVQAITLVVAGLLAILATRLRRNLL